MIGLTQRACRRGGSDLVALLGLTLCVLAFAAPASAQRLRDAVLIFPPIPDDRAADSTYVVELAAEVRSGLMRWRRFDVRMMDFCAEADFCSELPPHGEAMQSARLLRADVFVTGAFRRIAAVPEVDLDIRETARRGGVPHYTMSLTVRADTALSAKDFAKQVRETLKDPLETVLRASHYASACWERVRDHKYEDAYKEADRAFRDFPNHPSAARCLSYVYLAKQDSDSLLWALKRAVAGDPRMTDAWEEMGLEYARRGERQQAVQARIQEVRADPDNAPRRMKVARLLDRMGEKGAAVQLVREGAERAGSDLQFRHLLARMCYDYRMWPCALESLADLYRMDSSLVGDTTFYFQIIAAAQTLRDTVAVDEWTAEAVRHVQLATEAAWARALQARRDAEQTQRQLNTLRMARAAVLADMGMRDSAVAVYRVIASADPLNARAAIAAAQVLTGERFLVLDASVPLDSTVLVTADSLLASAVHRSDDEQVRRSVGLVYFDVGMRLVQHRVAPALALYWLTKAVEHQPTSPIHQRVSALTGIAYFYLVEDADTRVRADQTCDLVEYEADLVAEGLLHMPSVALEFPTMSDGIADAFAAYDALIPAYRRSLHCDVTAP
jgi:tetratricopeptide (TPR) repeat protein